MPSPPARDPRRNRAAQHESSEEEEALPSDPEPGNGSGQDSGAEDSSDSEDDAQADELLRPIPPPAEGASIDDCKRVRRSCSCSFLNMDL